MGRPILPQVVISKQLLLLLAMDYDIEKREPGGIDGLAATQGNLF